jgi:DNA-binding response OmpR family regulator
MKHQFRILVIDDDLDLLKAQQEALSMKGFEVIVASDALTGLRSVYQDRPDAVLLDVMLPEMDGFEACRRIREMTDIPVLLVTGRATTPEDIVQGFAVGADDFVIKPFNQSELVSRLLARLQRASRTDSSDREFLSPDASVILNSDRHELIIEGRSIYLPPKEFQVLRLLIRYAGQVLSANAILAQVWGPERIGETELVKQYMYRLRKKIEPDQTNPKYIHSVRGEGYYFQVPFQSKVDID